MKKETLELLLYLSFKVEFFTYGFQAIFFPAFKISADVKNLLLVHGAFHSYLGLKFPEFLPRKGDFPLYPYSEVIGLTNLELIILNYESEIHEFFW